MFEEAVNRYRFVDIRDGLSSTILFGEIAAYRDDLWGMELFWGPTWSSFTYGWNDAGWVVLEPAGNFSEIYRATDP